MTSHLNNGSRPVFRARRPLPFSLRSHPFGYGVVYDSIPLGMEWYRMEVPCLCCPLPAPTPAQTVLILVPPLHRRQVCALAALVAELGWRNPTWTTCANLPRPNSSIPSWPPFPVSIPSTIPLQAPLPHQGYKPTISLLTGLHRLPAVGLQVEQAPPQVCVCVRLASILPLWPAQFLDPTSRPCLP